MKNFWTLFGYEMKKLCKQPLTWVTAVLLTALSVFVAQGGLQPDFGHDFYSQTTGELIEFVAEADWSARMQEGGLALNGQVMDDAFFQTMKERVPDIEDYDEREQYFYYKDSTYRHAYSMTDFNNGDPRDNTAESFYAGRRALLEQRWENYGLSETEKDYWRAMDEQVSKPFIYEYPWRGTEPNGLSSTLYTMIVPLSLAVAVCLCQIFSKDRSTRVDALAFASRNGRVPLYLAKILAGTVGALIMSALILGGHMIVYLFRYGTQGLGAPIQMLSIAYSFPITVGDAVAYMMLIMVQYTLACGALTMLVSALSRRAIVSLIVPVVSMFVLTQSKVTAPYLPHNLVASDGFLNPSLFNVLGVYLNIFQICLLLYPLIAVSLFILCWPGWRRQSISGA